MKGNYESNQQDATIQVNLLFLLSSTCFGNVFAHHQEHLTVFTASGSIHPNWCRLVSWMSQNGVPTHPWHHFHTVKMRCKVYFGTRTVLLYQQWQLNIQNAGWLLCGGCRRFQDTRFFETSETADPATASRLRRPEFSLKITVITCNGCHLPVPAATCRGSQLSNTALYSSSSTLGAHKLRLTFLYPYKWL